MISILKNLIVVNIGPPNKFQIKGIDIVYCSKNRLIIQKYGKKIILKKYTDNKYNISYFKIFESMLSMQILKKNDENQILKKYEKKYLLDI